MSNGNICGIKQLCTSQANHRVPSFFRAGLKLNAIVITTKNECVSPRQHALSPGLRYAYWFPINATIWDKPEGLHSKAFRKWLAPNEPRCDQSEPMLGFPQRHDAGVGSNSMIGRVDLDRTVESRLKKSTLYIAHRFHPVLCFVLEDVRTLTKHNRSRGGYLHLKRSW